MIILKNINYNLSMGKTKEIQLMKLNITKKNILENKKKPKIISIALN